MVPTLKKRKNLDWMIRAAERPKLHSWRRAGRNWRRLGTRSIQSTQPAAISPGHPRRGGIAAASEVEAVGRVVSCAQTFSGRDRGVSRLAAWSTTVSAPAP